MFQSADDFHTKNRDAFVSPYASIVQFEDLEREARGYLTSEDLGIIHRAYQRAKQAHTGGTHSSGEPPIQHALEVALLLAHMRIDAEGIAAALLSGRATDTSYTLAHLQHEFGDAIAKMAERVTQFSTAIERSPKGSAFSPTPPVTDNPSPQQATVVRQMLLAIVEDPRVVVLKLADQLYTMRTLSMRSPVHQQHIVQGTRDIYAPLARRLGMTLVQAELEDLALSYMQPERYIMLAHEVEKEYLRRQPSLAQISASLQKEMEQAAIPAEVHTWQRHLASIDRTLRQRADRTSDDLLETRSQLAQMHNLISFRILVDSIQDCYLALGHIHALWRPKDGQIKDFIAVPKLNGYRSLHTTVFSVDNQLVDIQIRTYEMERTADYGIASYWYLKEKKTAALSYQETLAWLDALREWQRDLQPNTDASAETVKTDLFEDQIFVFTPKGEVKNLPRGSTPLDLAYHIHTDIGNHCMGARIVTNVEDTGRLVTRTVGLDYPFKGGEIVDIITGPKAHPTRDWLIFACTTRAHRKIRRYLNMYEREVSQQLGRERLDLALKAVGTVGLEAIREQDLSSFMATRKYTSLNDLYVALGKADLPVTHVLDHLSSLLQARGVLLPQTPIATTVAHCCYPLPGDAVVGLVNPDKGVVVHRNDCRTVLRYREQGRETFVDIDWLQIEQQRYVVPIIIVAFDRASLLRDVASVAADSGINITALSATISTSLRRVDITATLEVESVSQLEEFFTRLRQLKNVVSVGRNLRRSLPVKLRSERDHLSRTEDFESYQELIRKMLFLQGVVDPSAFPGVPITHVDRILQQYMQQFPDLDLRYQKRSSSLHLHTIDAVRRIHSLLEPLVYGVANGTWVHSFEKFAMQVAKMLQAFAAVRGWGEVLMRDTTDLATFSIEATGRFESIRLPDWLPVFASPTPAISDDIIEHLLRMLTRGQGNIKSHVAILILFCERDRLDAAKQRLRRRLGDVYACDVVVLSHEDLLDSVAARDSERVWQRSLLSQVSLTTIAPYVITGPTPTHLFFGREHELREIATHVRSTSYAVIGGRRIGKTSIMRCLHETRLPSWGFRTMYYDCSTIPSYDGFLSACVRDWKPTPPLKAPTTFGELLQFSSDDKPLVLLLDEVDKLVPIDRENGWKIFNTLRALVNSRQAHVVLSGERTLREALKDSTSPLFNFANEVLLGPLDYAAVEELITKPMRQLEIELVDEKGIVRHIFDFTSGHPNIVQRLCLRLIERLNKQQARRLTLESIRTVTQDLHFQEIDFLQTYWEAAPPLEKIITLVILEKTEPCRLKEVRLLLTEHAHIQPSAAETKDALDRLVDLRSLLRRSSAGYEFAVEAFPRVLKKTTSIEDLLEVFVEQYNQME